ncbi:unnamed protein product [Paramecium sonneborni]|uniref:Uncharacterized protein n=1 Tax=Paramecium sonneborni TaxID=65129 RepID=A0A8S1MFB5_9CILI|nr:unnamed protein product [Paramecium sonneborni]
MPEEQMQQIKIEPKVLKEQDYNQHLIIDVQHNKTTIQHQIKAICNYLKYQQISFETQIQPNVGQFIKNQQSQFVSSQLRKSPSFRVKNYHPQEIVNTVVQQTNQNQIQSNNEKIERINRINFLGDLLQQMSGNNQQAKLSIVTELTTVPKKTAAILNFQNEKEENIEELHFYLVESQQRIKQHTYVLEQQKYLS